MKLTPALLTLIMLLVVGGLVTAYVAKSLLARDEAPPADPTVNIPMALTDLQPGTVITEGHVGLGPALTSKLDREVLRTTRVVVGRVVKEPIERAQPIRTSQLYGPGERPPLAVLAGMRAVSVALADGTALVDGLIQPGQYVDVHFTPSAGQNIRGGMVMTLFEGVKLLAINRSQTSAPTVGRGENSVTMELTPEQANILILARDKGDINLTYSPGGQGNGGVAVADENRAYLDEILGLQEPELEEEEAFVTEIFSGLGRRVNTFDDDGVLSAGSSVGGREAPATMDSRQPGGLQQELPDTQSGNGREAMGADRNVWPGRGAAAPGSRSLLPANTL